MKKLPLINLALSFISLMAFWLVMSGIYKPAQIAEGVVSVLIVIAVNHKLKSTRFFEDEMEDISRIRFLYTPFYLVWLTIEIVLAGLHVARVILSPAAPIETIILKFKVRLPGAHAKMILGNSITLTPGTLTIDIEGDEFTVHALTTKSFQGLVDDTMPRKVLKLFQKEDRPVIHDVRIFDRADRIPGL